MGILDRLRDIPFEVQLIKSINRQAAATERLGDLIESLLPSPLTSDTLTRNDLKSASSETFRVYDQKEAYLDEQRKKRSDLSSLLGEEEEG